MISCNNISFGYSDKLVLGNISLELCRSETLVLLGRSGCGKTTLLKILSGVINPSSGTVLYDFPIENSYAFAFQSPAFFPWLKVRENVDRICSINGVGSSSTKILSQFGLSQAHLKYPWQLSGGMQRRLSIAMALSLHRPLLLLDEPGSGLDDWTKETLLGVLDTSFEEYKTTCVATTHSLFEAIFLADRIVLLGGTPATILFEYKVELQRPRLSVPSDYLRIMDEVERLRERLALFRYDA